MFLNLLLLAFQLTLPSHGEVSAGWAAYDVEVQAFLAKHEVRAASVAVADQGQVVLARGYGIADTDTGAPVSKDTLFRIASLSKPITAVAILKLVQDGRLHLSDRAYERLGLDSPSDPRCQKITVRMLLEHRGGWDREVSFDPMFQSIRFAKRLGIASPPSADQMIEAMADQPLDFEPGSKYAYSNFGYCLLGRIIEKVTGLSYEQYVCQEVLQPIGITSMRIGRTLPEQRGEDEVTYDHEGTGPCVYQSNLGQDVASPDGAWCLEAMDSHGGWLASASDLVRLAIALESPHPKLLDANHLRWMHRRPAAEETSDVFYSLGWQNRVVRADKINHWHTGSLPGTTSLLIRRHDGKIFAALLNTRQSPHTKNLAAELDQMLHRAAGKVADWQ